ncbi:Uncharacterised protein [Acinetobacter baumannii]|nr:Uncharacterised protein [Acinetobacter baumannii]
MSLFGCGLYKAMRNSFAPRTLRVSGELLAGMTSTNFSFA